VCVWSVIVCPCVWSVQHIFCEDCVSAWFNRVQTCPVCLCVVHDCVCVVCNCLSVCVLSSTYSVKTVCRPGSTVSRPVRCVELRSLTRPSGGMELPALVYKSSERDFGISRPTLSGVFSQLICTADLYLRVRHFELGHVKHAYCCHMATL